MTEKLQQYGYLNKTCTMTPPVDTKHKGEKFNRAHPKERENNQSA
jgi:hypothetical protein